MTTLLIPVNVDGYGDCLPRSTSLLVYGTQNHPVEMRARIVVELVTNEALYLDTDLSNGTHVSKDLAQAYAPSVNFYELQELLSDAIKTIFRKKSCRIYLTGILFRNVRGSCSRNSS